MTAGDVDHQPDHGHAQHRQGHALATQAGEQVEPGFSRQAEVEQYEVEGMPGQRGIGKFDLARGFAESLLCENPLPSRAACGACLACGWMAQGKLKSKEDIVEGLETFPETLMKLFNGENFGKLVLKVN